MCNSRRMDEACYVVSSSCGSSMTCILHKVVPVSMHSAPNKAPSRSAAFTETQHQAFHKGIPHATAKKGPQRSRRVKARPVTALRCWEIPKQVQQ